mgnify:CR=1 FL=1
MIDELIGWFGIIAILLSYILLNFKLLSLDNLIYYLLNFLELWECPIFRLRGKFTNRLL